MFGQIGFAKDNGCTGNFSAQRICFITFAQTANRINAFGTYTIYNYSVTALVKQIHCQCESLGVDFEILAADDCSIDHTEENLYINTFTNTRLLQNERNLGRTMTRKKLADSAKYEMLLFLDADVVPVSEKFIENYLPYVQQKTPVVFGGYAYTDEKPGIERILRYKYGKFREEKPLTDRSLNPYGYVFSGNLLLRKDIFNAHNFSGPGKFYGLDVYFSHSLFKAGVPVVQIDNRIYHLGIEENEIFFKKALDSVATKKELMESDKAIVQINPLMKSYRLIQKSGLKSVVKYGFKITEPFLRKMILRSNPSLFALDVYRLGYLCSLK